MKKFHCALIGCAVLLFASKAYAWVEAVPEMDAGSVVTALGVLSGVVALAAERLRRK